MKKSFIVTMSAMLVLLGLNGCSNLSKSAAAAPKTAVTTTESETEQALELNGHTLSIYCGAGMTKPFQKIADAFKEQTGCEMEITFANAGQIQTQINTAKEGDLFLAGSADELKPVADVVTDSKELVKHIPVLVVKSGNPFKITKLEDLANETIRLVLGDKKSTPIGKISDKALTDAGIREKVNVIARTTTAPEIVNALMVDECDAIIVWKENVTDKSIEIVNTEEMEKYTKTVPAASLSYCEDKEALSAFLEFLNSHNANTIWTKFGYEVIK
ncbi:molybdate ABC transporter substrate-binding protein [Clostridium sp. E02]|uniref:molybdate ABC transporter substrate-binding protein n=1 Tax=Clostridium sp. E02 TaxID=2487134 RepID=UPI001FAAA87C|nr:molybdate ABC transporter substrate-binding protein [Clostridium sp. E02]